MIFLKNYTSDVPVSTTIGRIEKVLIQCGVSSIEKEYGPQAEIAAIRFRIKLLDREVAIRLPCDRNKALEALWLNYVDGATLNAKGDRIEDWGSRKRRTKDDFAEQAERTAWRIMQDWIEVQMSLIQMKQAETLEVFLPYVWDGKSTVWTRIKEGNYRALLPESC